jgi:cobalt-zinc-cadmium efflux system protein
MSNCHHHHHHHQSTDNIAVAFYLNLCFTIIELIGGIFTNSLAILSDAIHDLGDTIALGFSFFMEKLAKKNPDELFSYGYQRFSLLAALITAMVLVMGSGFIVIESIPRLLHPEDVHSQGMLLLALLGIAFNGLAALRLRHGKTLNEQAVSLHMIEDMLGWVGVLLTAIAIEIWQLTFLDPLFSLLFSLYILFGALKNLKKTLLVFLQSTPDNIDSQHIETDILALPEVREIHDTHIWSLDGAAHIFTAHIVLHPHHTMLEFAAIKHNIHHLLEHHHIHHSTLELEGAKESCSHKETHTHEHTTD